MGLLDFWIDDFEARMPDPDADVEKWKDWGEEYHELLGRFVRLRRM
jgi:hypothetical protein